MLVPGEGFVAHLWRMAHRLIAGGDDVDIQGVVRGIGHLPC